jgi:glutamyl-tRNA synthetase/glutamyl-Q tRNA(Asp) synthetase
VTAPVVTRFAPAPTGYLHLGHVKNALEVWDFAAAHNGRVLLRVEDHDRQRSRPEYEAALREDLAWLGFAPDAEVPRQSERDAVYRDTLAGLVARGLVFGCDCSRVSRYPGTCRERGLALTDGVGWRVRMDPGLETFTDLRLGPQSQSPAEQCGDVLVRDRLGNWTYQWAVVVDDYLQGVTHIVRGEDLLDSTGRQIRLARLAGRPAPAVFLHHALVMKSPTQKLSKRNDDTGVRDLRARGWSPADVRAAAAAAC